MSQPTSDLPAIVKEPRARPADESVVVREQPLPLGPITWSNKLCSCNGNSSSCCKACCCPLLSLSELAERIESNIFGKEKEQYLRL